MRKKLARVRNEILHFHHVARPSRHQGWYKVVDVPAVIIEKVEESDLSLEGKARLRGMLEKAQVSHFKNDCGSLPAQYTHAIIGGVHPAVRQYPLHPGAVEEMDLIVKELTKLQILREEQNPMTNSPIQAVKKPDGSWRPVINFKALNRRTVANKASLINPQGTLKTLQVKKFKTCIDLANGFFSLPLARQSQGKTALTHKGKAYVWQRLPQGYKNSPNVFQSAVMEVLRDLDVTIYIDDVFIADDTEGEHLQRLDEIIQRLSSAGLKLNLKKCQFGKFQVTYLGFQISEDLGLSDGYRSKIEQIIPPASIKDLQKILGLCNYVRDHVPGYQKFARPLYARLRKTEERGFAWAATDQNNLEGLKGAITEAVRLQPRDPSTRLMAEINVEDNEAVVTVWNEGKQLITLWSYVLTTVEQKFPGEEKELAVIARYWSSLKDLAQGQQIQIITQSNVHRFLRKGTVESTKATNTRWGRWEDILLDPDLEIGPTHLNPGKINDGDPPPEKHYEWTVFTDGSRKGQDLLAYWGFILKQNGEERYRQRGKATGSAQVGEVTAILESLLELEKIHITVARIITDSRYCYQALKEDLEIWEENGFEGAKGKQVAHSELWTKISQLRHTM